MKINMIGYDSRHEDGFSICRPCGSGDYLITVIRENTVIRLKNEICHAASGDMVFFDKGSEQFFYGENGTYADDWVHFSDDGGTAFLSGLTISRDTILHPSDPEMFCSSSVRWLLRNTIRQKEARRYLSIC